MHPASSQYQRYFPYALLVLAGIAAYFNVYDNAFLFDDEFLLQKNAWLHSWDHLGDIFISSTTAGFGGHDPFYRPLQIFSYWLVTQLFGFSGPAYHAFNVLVHVANACMVFALAGKMGFRRVPALLASLIWVVHPIHTEAVTYMSATADVLHVFFVLCAALVWKEGNFRSHLQAAGLMILGILSKETAIVLPALITVIIFFRQKQFDRKAYLETWPLWLVASLYLAARATVLNFDHTFQFYPQANVYTEHLYVRIYTFLATLPDYAKLLVAPFDLHMERHFAAYAEFFLPQVMLGVGIFALAAVIGLAGAFNKKAVALRPLAFGLAWFFAAYFPCSGLVIPVNAIFLEHWMYLPTIGLMIGLAETLAGALGDNKMVRAGAVTASAAVVVFFAVLTVQQNATWSDPITFYTNILKYEKGTARLHNNLAMAYEDGGKLDEAMAHYQQAIATDDSYAQTRYNLGRLFFQTGHVDESLVNFKRSLEIDPNFPYTLKTLANYYRSTNQPALAEEYERRLQQQK